MRLNRQVRPFLSSGLSRTMSCLKGNNMENAYRPELWRDMFVLLGSSAAALIGLLFIATSLHLNEVINNPSSRRRAFNNTCYLLIILVEALLLLMPQPMSILGAELISINLLGLWLPLKVIFTLLEDKEVFFV
jgi:hypothetical protein